jgi:hypothetical protein
MSQSTIALGCWGIFSLEEHERPDNPNNQVATRSRSATAEEVEGSGLGDRVTNHPDLSGDLALDHQPPPWASRSAWRPEVHEYDHDGGYRGRKKG